MTYASKRCHECGNIIVPKRPLEIVEYIKKEDALLEAKIRSIEEELAFLHDHK
jgi:hypothetical protein